MAWNKNLPADASKLRLSAGIIRANWDALETGGVPYDYLQLQEQAVNPTRQNNTGWIFSKDPGSGFTEFYYEDDRNPAIVTRLTNNGGIGALGQLIYGSAIVTSGTYQNTQNAFCSAWARVNSAGTLLSGFGVTSSRISTGLYEITFISALSHSNYSVVATTFDNTTPDHNRVAMMVTQAVGSFRLRMQRIDQSGGNTIDVGFSVAVFGGR